MNPEGRFKVARVRWRIGQPLLPEHFYAQEESLREEMALRFRLLGVPDWGCARLTWDQGLLQEGVLKILGLTLIFRDGQIVDVGGNAEPPEPFNLKETGLSQVAVFAQLSSESRVIRTEPGDPDEESIERIVQRIRLTTNEASPDGPPAFEIGRFEEIQATQKWHLIPDSLPALVRVKATPFYDKHWEWLVGTTDRVRRVIQNQLDIGLLSGDTQIAARQLQRGFYTLEAFILNVTAGDLNPHPYEVYSLLQSLYVDFCVFRGITPKPAVYQHADLGRVFAVLRTAFEELLEPHDRELPHVAFEVENGLQICHLTARAKKARRIFWLVKKPKASQNLDLKGVKLASAARLHTVHTHALRGVPFKRLENPPFSHQFSSNVEFYALTPGEEWDYARDDGRLAFFDSPQLAGAQSFLYYRDE